MEFSINYLAVLVAGISNMIIGFLWYGPVFGKVWTKLAGFTPESMAEAQKKGMGKSYALAFLGALISAFVIAHFLQVWVAVDALGALELAFWLWLGFIATSFLGSVLWEGKSWKLYFLNIFYYLVVLSVQGLILVYWV